MPDITVDTEGSVPVTINVEVVGEGRPVVLVHGFPLDGRSWEKQTFALVDAGYQAVTYDRRGFGASSRPGGGYDYDTFAADLDRVITELDLRDVVLGGFSMGGGEVARYLGTYGSDRVGAAVFIGAVPPYLLKADDNPQGPFLAENIQDGVDAIGTDRFAYLTGFLSDFYNLDDTLGTLVSEEVVRDNWNTGAAASAIATRACPPTWVSDFRGDLAKITVPTLAIHGSADRLLPIEATARRLPVFIEGCQVVEVEGAPHGLLWTHAEQVNEALIGFVARTAAEPTAA